MRVESQSLVRLPMTGKILFAIHVDQMPLERLTKNQRHLLLLNLQSCPIETIRYKAIDPMLDALTRYLAESSR